MNQNLSFADVAERWFGEKQKTLKEASIASYKSMLQTKVIPYWEQYRVDKINKGDLAKFAKELEETEGLAKVTVSNYITFTRMIIRYGMEISKMEKVASKDKSGGFYTLTIAEQKKTYVLFEG